MSDKAAREEAERLMCRTFDDAGKSICESPAGFIVWGHLYAKRDKGPKCARHLPPYQGAPWLRMQAAIYEIPAQAARPVVVTEAQVEAVALHLWDEGIIRPESLAREAVLGTLAALNVTVEAETRG